MSKQKFDLSNVGGQPKDWLDRANEPSEFGAKEWAMIAALVIGSLAALYGIATWLSWVLRG